MAESRPTFSPASFAMREFEFTDADFRYISNFIYSTAKIVLKDEKRPMVYSRLVRRIRAHQLKSFADYISYVQRPEGNAERQELLNAITTNLTSFFRENHHFEHLKNTAMSAVLKRNQAQPKLRIWSAGCSSGQEPYSIAMSIYQSMPNNQYDIKILATDLDTHMVSYAQNGIYASTAATEIPLSYRQTFCRKDEKGDIHMDDTLKNIISFRSLNLFDAWPMQGKFDIIFCRNVVIYFDKETQSKLFHRFAEHLAPNGFMYIGHSESLYNVCDRFKLIGKTIYQLDK